MSDMTPQERIAARQKVLCRFRRKTVELPLLEADDFCKGRNMDPRGRCCLMLWKYQVSTVMVGALHKAIESQLVNIGYDLSAAAFNDDPTNPPERLATVWNAAVRSLEVK